MIDPASHQELIVWLNGAYTPIGRAGISPLDRGFLYGDGVFETLRAESGCILELRNHLERLHHSLAVLRITLQETIEWESTLLGLLTHNALDRTTASLKIVVTRGVSPAFGLPQSIHPTVLLVPQRYDPPTDAAYRAGWNLIPFRAGFSPPLACHKSLNYLYFMMARQYARDQGADEAIILDPAGRITETAAGTLLLRSQGTWWTPSSPYQLPSVTLKRLGELFARDGQSIQRQHGTIADLEGTETVWVLSSLQLIMPACSIAGRPLPNPAVEEAARWRRSLLPAP